MFELFARALTGSLAYPLGDQPSSTYSTTKSSLTYGQTLAAEFGNPVVRDGDGELAGSGHVLHFTGRD